MIDITLTEAEVQNLRAMMDAALRHIGLEAALPVAALNQKLAQAVEQAKGKNVVSLKDAASG